MRDLALAEAFHRQHQRLPLAQRQPPDRIQQALVAVLRFRRVQRAGLALVVQILCATLLVLLFAVVFMPLLLLAMLPYATAVSYAAYRDVCDGVHA